MGDKTNKKANESQAMLEVKEVENTDIRLKIVLPVIKAKGYSIDLATWDITQINRCLLVYSKQYATDCINSLKAKAEKQGKPFDLAKEMEKRIAELQKPYTRKTGEALTEEEEIALVMAEMKCDKEKAIGYLEFTRIMNQKKKELKKAKKANKS